MGEFTMPPMHEFFLMHAKADRALRGVVSRAIEKSSLTMTEWLALAVIAAGPKDGLRMTQVAQELDVTLPQVTALVTSLIEKGFSKQRIFIGDRRGRQVFATLKGKRLLVGLEVDTGRALEEFSKSVEPEQFRDYMATTKLFSEDNVKEEVQEETAPPPAVNVDSIEISEED